MKGNILEKIFIQNEGDYTVETWHAMSLLRPYSFKHHQKLPFSKRWLIISQKLDE